MAAVVTVGGASFFVFVVPVTAAASDGKQDDRRDQFFMMDYALMASSFLDRRNGFGIPSSNNIETVGTSTSVMRTDVVRPPITTRGAAAPAVRYLHRYQ